MSVEDKRVSRRGLSTALAATGIGVAAAPALGGAPAAHATAPGDWHNVKVDHGAAGDGVKDDTAAINNAVTAAASTGGTVYFPPGNYRVEGTVAVGVVSVEAAYGAVIEHYPADNTTDCIVVSGLNAGRTKISGLQVKGQQNGHTLGRDLLRVSKGDYVVLEDLYLASAKRDAVHVEPNASSAWIENLLLINVKVQSPVNDAFHFEIPAGPTAVFINQTTMINCESRSAGRHALGLFNHSTGAASNKISAFKVLNCELAGAGSTSEPLVKLLTSGSGTIENIAVEDSAVEDTASQRTGYAILITGNSMSGLFSFENSIHFGTALTGISGLDLFPHYSYRNITSSAYVPRYESHMGVYKKYRTAPLNAGGFEDTYTLQSGEVIKGYVLDRFNSGNYYAEFTCWGGTTPRLFAVTQQNVSVGLTGSTIRLTNSSTAGGAYLELFLQRITKDSAN
jgi:hypothetical protein